MQIGRSMANLRLIYVCSDAKRRSQHADIEKIRIATKISPQWIFKDLLFYSIFISVLPCNEVQVLLLSIQKERCTIPLKPTNRIMSLFRKKFEEFWFSYLFIIKLMCVWIRKCWHYLILLYHILLLLIWNRMFGHLRLTV